MSGAKIPLRDMADTIEARGRAARKFPARMTAETVDRIETHCHLGAATLRIIDTHADGLRHLIEFLRGKRTDARRRLLANPSDAEAAALLSHPAVRVVLETFPEAVLDGVEQLSTKRFANPEGSGEPFTTAEPFDQAETEE